MERMDRNVLKWFDNVERLDKIVYPATVEGNRGRRRPHKRLRDEVKELLMEGEI